MPQVIQDHEPKFDDMLDSTAYCPKDKKTYKIVESDRGSFKSHWNGTRESGETVYGIPCPCGGFIHIAPNHRLIHSY